jgi:hypothetical protein
MRRYSGICPRGMPEPTRHCSKYSLFPVHGNPQQFPPDAPCAVKKLVYSSFEPSSMLGSRRPTGAVTAVRPPSIFPFNRAQLPTVREARSCMSWKMFQLHSWADTERNEHSLMDIGPILQAGVTKIKTNSVALSPQANYTN